jgi:AcrR family transcriptional regulator
MAAPTMTSPAKTSAPARKRVRRNNEQDADRLREQFVDAAFALFAEGGLAAVSIRSVAARVGVSPMVLYWYFADKSELLTSLSLAVLKNVNDTIRAATAAAATPRERVRALVQALLSYWEGHPDHFALVYGFTEIGQAREGKSKLAQFPMYGELLAHGREVTAEFAASLGASDAHVKLACDVRQAMALGWLHGSMVVTRYPWSDSATLRATYVERMLEAMEQCLLHGPATPAPAAAPAPRRTRARG